MKRLHEGAHQESLSGAWRAEKEDAFGWFDVEGCRFEEERRMQDFAKILNGLLETTYALVEEGEGIRGEGGSRRGLRDGGRGSIILVLEADLRLVRDCAEVQRRRFRFRGKREEINARHNSANRKLRSTNRTTTTPIYVNRTLCPLRTVVCRNLEETALMKWWLLFEFE